jgi:U3 small nucleolar RNA-associated protein 12
MDLLPNKKGIVTGSEDKLVKFWDFDLVLDEGQTAKRLTCRHTRSLQLDEGILCVKVSPNGKFIAVSLLDSTVKIFFMDSLKFFLNLYGHKFPVLSLDISSDSTLIATGSSDKNIKIWGMDFGDCHKSIFAHEEPITCVKFLPNTHYLLTSGKEGLLKEWDADHFEKIITLRGHLSEIWSFAVSPNAKYVASVSHDRTIRLWEKTSEPLILDEEQEEEREAEYERNAYEGCETLVPGEMNQETGFANKKTAFTVRGTELLLEAIDVHTSECESLRAFKSLTQKAKQKPDVNTSSSGSGRERRGGRAEGEAQQQHEHESPPAERECHPLLLKFNTKCPDRFVLETIRSIKSSDLDEALLSLPFHYASKLIHILSAFLERNWEFELVNRCLTFLTR